MEAPHMMPGSSSSSLLVAGEEALAYLELRAELYELIIRVRLLEELRPKEAEPRLAELAVAITAAEEDARERRQVLPIDYLRSRVGLGGAAEDILLLAVCAEVDPRFGQLFARYSGSPVEDFVSIGLCQLLLGQDRRSRLRIARLLRPGSPLLDCGLLSLVPGAGPRHGRTAHRLVAAPYLPSFLLGDVTDPEPIQAVAETAKPEVNARALALPPTTWERAWELVNAGRHKHGAAAMDGPGGYDVPAARTVLLTGAQGSGRRLLAMALAQATGHRVIRVSCETLALMSLGEATSALKLLVEYAWFGGRWLLFEDAENILGASREKRESLAPFLTGLLKRVSVTVFFTTASADQLGEPLREILSGCVAMPAIDRKRLEEMAELHWTRLANGNGASPPNFKGFVEQRVLTPVAVRNAVVLATQLADTSPLRQSTMQALTWAAEGLEAASMGTLATRAQQSRSLSDLVLPRDLTEQLETLIQTVRVRHHVHQTWGLDRRSGRGLGLSCLFHGESGTGKTLAAEVIATEVGLPLYQVNMAEIVSKYIGETSKNLSRVFNEASKSRCVLLFDEADAMFSKRTEVKKSTDRYSNMEINLLLQLMEAYDGITICTTNLKAGIDSAFERRFSFVLHFPEPDAAHRLHIWRLHLPPTAPIDPRLREALVDIAAEYDLAGGNIRSCVLRAAYQSAIAGEPVTERHLRDAIRHVQKSMGKLVRDEELDAR